MKASFVRTLIYIGAAGLACGALASSFFDQGSISPNIPQLDALTLQTKLAQAYSRRGCEEIGTLAPVEEVSRLPALGVAVVAACVDDSSVAERLFQSAEASDPTNTAIYFLHAKVRWRRDHAAAEPLWRKVEMLARDPGTKQIARSFLDGTANGNETISLEADWNYFVDARFGGGYETNPAYVAPSTLVIQTSPSINGSLNAGAQRRFATGSLSVNYTFTGNVYTAASSSTFLQHDLEVPFNLRAGTNEDLRIRPYGTYLSLGNSPYYEFGGIALQGIAYRGKFRQLVEGSVFADHYASPSLQPQDGTHLHFDYRWEYYPLNWFARWLFYLEHVQAGRASGAFGSTPYSHNDLGFQAFLEWNLGFTLLGLNTKLAVRDDDNDSRYRIGSASAPTVSKRRKDLTLYLQPSASFPIGQGMYFILTYFFNQRWSNMGPNDVVDEGYADQGAQALFRITLEAL